MVRAKLSGWTLAALLAPAALLGELAAPGAAAVEVLKCESRVLQHEDERSLIAAAKAMLPRDIESFVTHPCRNPGNAHAGVVTAHFKARGGVMQWWELACQRGSAAWTCGALQSKQFIDTRLLVGGRLRRVALTIDGDTALDRAEQWSSQALTIYADPASRLPWCAQEEEPLASDWQVLRQRHPLPAGNKTLLVDVSLDGGTGSVTLTDIQVEIQFPAERKDSAGGAAAKCWNVWVVAS
jgi:hypothetical protein